MGCIPDKAAKAVGLPKNTLVRAIQSDRIIARKDSESGRWLFESSDLHQVYPALALKEQVSRYSEMHELDKQPTEIVKLLREFLTEKDVRLAEKDAMIAAKDMVIMGKDAVIARYGTEIYRCADIIARCADIIARCDAEIKDLRSDREHWRTQAEQLAAKSTSVAPPLRLLRDGVPT